MVAIAPLDLLRPQLLPEDPPLPPPPYQRPPASPTAPGFMPVRDVQSGPNGFQLGIDGPNPDLAVGGTTAQQDHQRDMTVALATLALSSYLSGHFGTGQRVPTDTQVAKILDSLHPNSPIGRDGAQVTHAIYQSHIPNATAAQGYQHFVNDPAAVFGAGGMEIRPPASHLTNGGRYMLEIGGPTPTWLPVQINLNPTTHSIGIQTLDGHVLRGEQTFTFTDDGHGGTVLTQDAHFQASSQLVGQLQELTSVANGQHQAWQFAHREIYEYFNGNPGYKGMGTAVFNQQQLSSWKEALQNLVLHPGTEAEAGLSALGQVTASGVDGVGNLLQRYFTQQGEGAVGNIVNQGMHKFGDGVAAAGHDLGVGAKKVIDHLFSSW